MRCIILLSNINYETGASNMREISPQEKTIMQIIWNAGDEYLTARDIESAMLVLDGKERNVASLMSILAKLADKGFLSPVKEFRKSTRYIPVINEAEYKAYVTRQFIEVIHGGEFASFVSALTDNGQYSAAEINQLRALLDTHKQRGKNSGGR